MKKASSSKRSKNLIAEMNGTAISEIPSEESSELPAVPESVCESIHDIPISEVVRWAHPSFNLSRFISRKKVEKAIDTLDQIMSDPRIDPMVRVKAANDILNRSDGLPSQSVQIQSAQVSLNFPEASKKTSKTIEAQQWLSRPISEWPPEILQHFGVTSG